MVYNIKEAPAKKYEIPRLLSRLAFRYKYLPKWLLAKTVFVTEKRKKKEKCVSLKR